MAAKWQGADETHLVSLLHPNWSSIFVACLGLTALAPGYRGEWRRALDKKSKLRPLWLVSPPRGKTESVQKSRRLFWVRDFTSHRWGGLPRTGKGRRKTERMSTLTQFTDDCFSHQQKKSPKPWGMEVEGEGRSGAGDRFSLSEEGVTPSELWKWITSLLSRLRTDFLGNLSLRIQ